MALRNDAQVALNELLIACHESAHCLEQAAKTLDDSAKAKSLSQRAQDRIAATGKIADEIKKQGDIPNSPPEERELLGDVLRNLKASLTAKAPDVIMLEHARKNEDALAAAAETFLSAAPAHPFSQTVAALKTKAETTL